MLILRRKIDECVDIFHGGKLLCSVMLCDVTFEKNQGAARIGFTGAPDVVFLRREVALARAAEVVTNQAEGK